MTSALDHGKYTARMQVCCFEIASLQHPGLGSGCHQVFAAGLFGDRMASSGGDGDRRDRWAGVANAVTSDVR
jgi:hypothetical protein